MFTYQHIYSSISKEYCLLKKNAQNGYGTRISDVWLSIAILHVYDVNEVKMAYLYDVNEVKMVYLVNVRILNDVGSILLASWTITSQ